MSQPLDQLLFYLEHPEDVSSDDEIGGRGGAALDTMETPTEPIGESSTSQPVRHSQRSLVTLYRRSSSASKYMKKMSHCYFCHSNVSVRSFEDHVRSHPSCLQLYERKMNVKSTEKIMVKIFPCFYCEWAGGRGRGGLQAHLEHNPSCRDQYFRRWGVNVATDAEVRDLNRGIR